MSKYTVNTEVNFFASLGYIGANREDINTLGNLGFTEEELDSMTDAEIEKDIQNQFEEWLYNHDIGWTIVE